MLANSDRIFLSPSEYLKWEPLQELRHEYIDGEAFAMTGGTLPHNAISLNLAVALKSHLRGKRCQTFGIDAKVGITPNGPFFYPDGLVTCDESDLKAIKYVLNPCFICEVLSESTEAYDRGNKFIKGYRRLESLKEYLLVKQDEIGVELRRLNERGVWENYYFGACYEEIYLQSLDFRFPVSLLYEDVLLPNTGVGEE